MKKLNKKQMASISGGTGCVCQPSNLRTITLNANACRDTCCTGHNSASYCTFQNGAKPVTAVNLDRVPHDCQPCQAPVVAWPIRVVGFSVQHSMPF